MLVVVAWAALSCIAIQIARSESFCPSLGRYKTTPFQLLFQFSMLRAPAFVGFAVSVGLPPGRTDRLWLIRFPFRRRWLKVEALAGAL